jgi:hypothetical protein
VGLRGLWGVQCSAPKSEQQGNSSDVMPEQQQALRSSHRWALLNSVSVDGWLEVGWGGVIFLGTAKVAAAVCQSVCRSTDLAAGACQGQQQQAWKSVCLSCCVGPG